MSDGTFSHVVANMFSCINKINFNKSEDLFFYGYNSGIIFLISPQKHMLCVFIRCTLLRHF